MDSRKPLTAGEIEELKEELQTHALEDTERTLELVFGVMPRLLSLLTPPPDAVSPDAPLSLQAAISIGELRYWTRKEGTGSGWVEGADVETVAAYVAALEAELAVLKAPPPDAAVREAVERLNRCADEDPIPRALADDICTLLRAVQAPRLNQEQVEAVKRVHARLMAYACPADEDAGEGLESAFPEAFAGEVGRGM